MTFPLPALILAALALALAACAEGTPAAIGPADAAANTAAAAPNEAQETIAPGPDGLYQGDPLAGPDLDPSTDPL